MTIACLEDLKKTQETAIAECAARAEAGPEIIVGMGTCGVAAGARNVMDRILEEVEAIGGPVRITSTGCVGMCEKEVLVDVLIPGAKRVTYGNVTPEAASRIVREHLGQGSIAEDYLVAVSEERIPSYRDLDFFRKQKRIALKNCGRIDPERIEDYIARGGYEGLAKAVTTMTPDEVVEEVKTSGLRGRGGGGFPTGMKWGFARMAEGDKKYIICNADEGDPGAFMDRSLLEGDPHSLIEGMTIAGYAIGADEGYIYVRAEYPLAIKRLRQAISQAEEAGLLGCGILGSDFRFQLRIKEGAGAFVCGEETALIASIEGRRGEPRIRPPFPAHKGLWGKPSNVNNVETFANVPQIVFHGGEWFAGVGTEKSKGTKVFALTGKIRNTGLAEVPMGITLREIIFEIGGGIINDKKFKAVQIGGPSGGCIPEELLDLPVDYDSLIGAGAMMGSGGLVVMDEDTCMVKLARFFLNFTQSESCGKCTPCREGTKVMLDILERITDGKGREGDIQLLESLARTIKGTSLCGLGQTAPNPVLSTLQYFRDEYEAHIRDGCCPAGECDALTRFSILEEKCIGCTACIRVCPVEAISGEARKPHRIDPAVCIRCGACIEKCPVQAIVKG